MQRQCGCYACGCLPPRAPCSRTAMLHGSPHNHCTSRNGVQQDSTLFYHAWRLDHRLFCPQTQQVQLAYNAIENETSQHISIRVRTMDIMRWGKKKKEQTHRDAHTWFVPLLRQRTKRGGIKQYRPCIATNVTPPHAPIPVLASHHPLQPIQ